MSARLRTGHDHQRKTCLRDFSQRHLFACQAYPALTAAGRGWFAGLGARLPNMLPLYDFKHPRASEEDANLMTRSIDQGRRTPDTQTPSREAARPKESGGACRDRTDDLKLAKLPLSQLS